MGVAQVPYAVVALTHTNTYVVVGAELTYKRAEMASAHGNRGADPKAGGHVLSDCPLSQVFPSFAKLGNKALRSHEQGEEREDQRERGQVV